MVSESPHVPKHPGCGWFLKTGKMSSEREIPRSSFFVVRLSMKPFPFVVQYNNSLPPKVLFAENLYEAMTRYLFETRRIEKDPLKVEIKEFQHFLFAADPKTGDFWVIRSGTDITVPVFILLGEDLITLEITIPLSEITLSLFKESKQKEALKYKRIFYVPNANHIVEVVNPER